MRVVLVRDGVDLASWPLPLPERPDATVVEALARLQVGAKRLGCRIELREVPAALVELLDFCGLRAEVGG